MNIGILTFYYQNYNYGAQLQAYALWKVLAVKGFNAEQIQYDLYDFDFWRALRHKPEKLLYYAIHPVAMVKRLTLILNPHKHQEEHLAEVQQQQVRQNAYVRFMQIVPHTERVYNVKNISESVKKYDAVIVGSDQVWTSMSTTFGLGFVPETKKSIAYAASCARTELSEHDIKEFKEHLPRFDAISVREQDSVALLQPYAGKNKIEWVLDPTMLLTKEDWDKICPKQIVEGKYMFCYFLGPDANMRKVTSEYAKKHNLHLVTLPHLTRKILADIDFGDEQLYNVSPADFLSLIKYAECVFTDSFHGSVISLLYHKQFYTFSRLNMPHMDNRSGSLLSMFDAEARFLNTAERMTLDYVEQLQDLDYGKEFPKFEEMKKSSMEFLERSLR